MVSRFEKNKPMTTTMKISQNAKANCMELLFFCLLFLCVFLFSHDFFTATVLYDMVNLHPGQCMAKHLCILLLLLPLKIINQING
jgi:hypothetical protein